MISSIGKRRPKASKRLKTDDGPLGEIDRNVPDKSEAAARTAVRPSGFSPNKKAGRKPRRVPPLYGVGNDEGIENIPSRGVPERRRERSVNRVEEIPALIGIDNDGLVGEVDVAPRPRESGAGPSGREVPRDILESPREEDGEDLALPHVTVTKHTGTPSAQARSRSQTPAASREHSGNSRDEITSTSSESGPRPCPPPSLRSRASSLLVEPGTCRTPCVQPETYHVPPVDPCTTQQGTLRTEPAGPNVQPGSYRTQPTVPSVQSTSFHVRHTVSSVEPCSYRTQPAIPSVQAGSYCMQPTVPSVQPSSCRIHPAAPFVQPGSYRHTRPTVPSVQPGSYHTQPAVPTVQPYTFLRSTQPVTVRSQPAASQDAQTSTSFTHTVSKPRPVTTETSSDSDCYCSDTPRGGREPPHPNTPAAPRVQFYDHSARYHREYRAEPAVVERLSAREVDAVRAAWQETERQEAPARWVQSNTGRVAQRARRGNQALERERVHRDYRELLDQLGHLSREERLLRSTQLPGPPLEVHQPDDRRKARLAVRQRNMDSAFERVFHSTSHPDDTATTAVTSQHTVEQPKRASRLPQEPIAKLNVAQLQPPAPAPAVRPPPVSVELPSPQSSQGSIVVGRQVPPPTLESLMERVNIQRTLLLREVGRDLRLLDAQMAPVKRTAEAVKRAAERELSDSGSSSHSDASHGRTRGVLTSEGTTSIHTGGGLASEGSTGAHTVSRNVVWQRTTSEETRHQPDTGMGVVYPPLNVRVRPLPTAAFVPKNSTPDEGTGRAQATGSEETQRGQKTKTPSEKAEDVSGKDKKDEGSQREDDAKEHKGRKTPKKVRNHKKKKKHGVKDFADFGRPYSDVDGGETVESSFTTMVSEYSMDMTLSKAGVSGIADSSVGSSSSSAYEGVKIVVSVRERGTQRTVQTPRQRGGGLPADVPPTTTTTASESQLKYSGNERRPCRDALRRVESGGAERGKTLQTRSLDKRTESVGPRQGSGVSHKDGVERRTTQPDKVPTHKNGADHRTTPQNKIATHKDVERKTMLQDKVQTHRGGERKTTLDKVLTHKDGVRKTTLPDKVLTHKDVESKTTPPDKVLTQKDGDEHKTTRADKSPTHKDGVSNEGPAWHDRLKQRSNNSSTSTSYNSPPEEVSLDRRLLVEQLLAKIDRQQARLDAWRSGLTSCVNPALAGYVRRLLGTSRERVDKLAVDVSDVPTPSSSVVGEPSNQEDSLVRQIADDIADEADFLGWRGEGSAVLTCVDTADNTTQDTSACSVMIQTRSSRFREPSPIPHEIPEDSTVSDREQWEEPTDDRTSPEIADMYRGLTSKCSERIDNLSLLIDRVRVEKRMILDGRNSLDSTRYESPPPDVSAPGEVAPPLMATPPLITPVLTTPPGSTSEGTVSTSLVARTVFLTEPGDGELPAQQSKPPPALWRNILRNDVPPTLAHELSAILETADQPRHEDTREEEEECAMPDVMAEMLRRRLITSPLPHLSLDSDTSQDSRSFYPSILEHVPPQGAGSEHRLEPTAERSTATDSRPDDSDEESTELDGMFDRLGLGWAGATLRKTRETERDLGSSSSDPGRNPRSASNEAPGRHSTPVGAHETGESSGESRYFSTDPSTVQPASSDDREHLSSSNTGNTPPHGDKSNTRHTPT